MLFPAGKLAATLDLLLILHFVVSLCCVGWCAGITPCCRDCLCNLCCLLSGQSELKALSPLVASLLRTLTLSAFTGNAVPVSAFTAVGVLIAL